MKSLVEEQNKELTSQINNFDTKRRKKSGFINFIIIAVLLEKTNLSLLLKSKRVIQCQKQLDVGF